MLIAIWAFAYIPCYLPEHSGPIEMLSFAGDGFGDTQVSGGRVIVQTVQNGRTFVPGNAALPLFCNGVFVEIKGRMCRYRSVSRIS